MNAKRIQASCPLLSGSRTDHQTIKNQERELRGRCRTPRLGSGSRLQRPGYFGRQRP